jgi:hypothetical protein
MTTTAMTEAPAASGALAAEHGTAAGRREERRQDRLVAAQIEREREAGRREARQAELDAAEVRRQRRAEESAAAAGARRAARAETLSALGGWVSEHSIDLMFTPVIGVPAWLGWDAMAGFGHALYGGPGQSLPVLSETAMWIFEFAIVRARRKDQHAAVWPLYVGMVAFALICAALNFMHGLTGPIPGDIPPGAEAGVVYALISVSGIIAHQIVALGGRKRKGATNPPLPGAGGPLGGPADGGAIAAERDRAVADRKRVERENAALRQQLADALRGDSDQDDRDRDEDAETPARRGAVRATMRAHWEKEIASGTIPNGAALNRAARKPADYSLGKRYASEWRNELPAEIHGKFTGDQQEAATQEDSTSAALAGLAR